MTCKQFLKLLDRFNREGIGESIIATKHWSAWLAHAKECKECLEEGEKDWPMIRKLANAELNWTTFTAALEGRTHFLTSLTQRRLKEVLRYYVKRYPANEDMSRATQLTLGFSLDVDELHSKVRRAGLDPDKFTGWVLGWMIRHRLDTSRY
jgi:hypothetical protein